MAFFVATCEYLATGEGLTHYIVAGQAEDKESFFKNVVVPKMGVYFAQGADVYSSWIELANDPIHGAFVSDKIKNMWKEYFEKGTGAGAYEFFLEYHVNYS